MNDQRNMILAIVLSMAVLFGWQFFIAGPQLEQAQRQAEVAADRQAAGEAARDGLDIAAPQGEPGAGAATSSPTDPSNGRAPT